MMLLIWVLAALLFVAVVHIAALHLTHWLGRRGGLTIHFEMEDKDDE